MNRKNGAPRRAGDPGGAPRSSLTRSGSMVGEPDAAQAHRPCEIVWRVPPQPGVPWLRVVWVYGDDTPHSWDETRGVLHAWSPAVPGWSYVAFYRRRGDVH